MASLGQFIQIKDLPESYMPVLLCQFVFQDGTILYASTHALNAGQGGFPAPDYFGEGNGAVDYFSRVIDQSLGELQALSTQGIGRIPAVTIKLANADQELWSNYELDPGIGFRGAYLIMRLAGWQVGTSNFTSDARVKFVGTCDAAYLEDEGTLVVTANNSHNTAALKLPDVPIQGRCPWSFPQTAAQRLDGATNRGSQFWNCGYCPDQAFTAPDGSPGPIGNYGPANLSAADGTAITDGAGVFLSCDYTRSSGPGGPDTTVGCMARMGNYGGTNIAPDGDISHDNQGRYTARFGGIQWSPGNVLVRSRSFETGAWVDALQYQNSTILGGFHNILYGRQFIAPKVANIVADGNSTRSEAVLCFGEAGYQLNSNFGPGGEQLVEKLIVNGVQLPFINDTTDYIFDWAWVATGARSGGLNRGNGFSTSQYQALSDCYGSLATIEFTVYRDLWDGGSAANVQALVHGPRIVRWTGSGFIQDYSAQTNAVGETVEFSPAWVLMDLLIRANHQYSDLDLATFLTAANFTNVQINYKDINGNQNQHARYMCEFALTQRATAADVIDSVLRCFDAYLIVSDVTGKIQLKIRQSIADQQPAPVEGSNDNTPFQSVHADGSAGVGYVAYHFNESNIARDEGPQGKAHISMVPSTNFQTPNEILIGFQDTSNQYVQDSLTQAEPMSAARCGGTPLGGQPGSAIVPETMNIRGINNFDQAYRIANRSLWERNYGNEIGDARGTRRFSIGVASGMRVGHLQLGHLVALTYGTLGIDQLFRVMAIAPGRNYESCRVEVAWHEDEWYTDAFAQNPYPYYSGNGADGAARTPYPWQPFADQPNDNSIYPASDYGFALEQVYAKDANGNDVVSLVIDGSAPVNKFNGLQRPHTPLEGNSTAVGGHIPGGVSILMALCCSDAVSADVLAGLGNLSAPSRICTAKTLAGNTNTVSMDLEGIAYPAHAKSWFLFAGPDANHLTYQKSGDSTGVPSENDLTITELNVATFGLPDQFFDHFTVKVKELRVGPIFGNRVTAVNGTAITIGDDNGASFAGCVLTLYSKGDPTEEIPIRDFPIASNGGGVINLVADPEGDIEEGDIVGVQVYADIFSSTTIGCTRFATQLAQLVPFTANSEVGNIVRIIAGTGAGQTGTIVANDNQSFTIATPWGITPDHTSIFIIELPSWLFSADQAPITVKSPTARVSMSVNVTNYVGQALLVMVQTVSAKGQVSNENLSPFRITYIAGAAVNLRLPYPWSTTDDVTLVAATEKYRHPNFGIKQNLLSDTVGHVTPQFVVQGKGIVNKFSTLTFAPEIRATIVPGGMLPAGATVTVGVWAQDRNGDFSIMRTKKLKIETGNSAVHVSVTFFNPGQDKGWVAITLDPNTGWYGPNAVAIPPGQTTFTFVSVGPPWVPVPDQEFDHLIIQARVAYVLGINGGDVIEVAGPVLKFNPDTWPATSLAGRTIACYFKRDPTQLLPLTDVLVLSSTTDSLTVDTDLSALVNGLTGGTTVSNVQAPVFSGTGLDDLSAGGNYTDWSANPGGQYTVYIASTATGTDIFNWVNNSTGGGGPSTPITGGVQNLDNGVTIQFGATTGHTEGDYWTINTVPGPPVTSGGVPGDGILVSCRADIFSANTIGDSLLNLVPSRYIGKLVMILKGTGAGQEPVPIIDNTATAFTTPGFAIAPGPDSEFIIINSAVDYEFESTALSENTAAAAVVQTFAVSIANNWQHYFVQARTADKNGNLSLVGASPYRRIFQPGFPDGATQLAPTNWGTPQETLQFGIGTDQGPADLIAGGTTPFGIEKFGGILYGWDAVCEVGPVGADIIIDVNRSNDDTDAASIFGDIKIVIPDGTPANTLVRGTSFSATNNIVGIDDRLQGLILQVGSSVPGQRVTINLYWRVQVPALGSQ